MFESIIPLAAALYAALALQAPGLPPAAPRLVPATRAAATVAPRPTEGPAAGPALQGTRTVGDNDPTPPSSGFYPIVGSIASGSAVSAGAGYRSHLFGSPVGFDLSAMLSIRLYQLYRLRVGLIDRRSTTLELKPADAEVGSFLNDLQAKSPGVAAYADIRYRDYTHHHFFGIGREAREEDYSAYRWRGLASDAVVQWQVSPAFGLAARVSWLESRIGRPRGGSHPPVTERFPLADLPGYEGAPRYLALGLAMAVDRRDEAQSPSRGFFVGTALWRFEGAGTRFDFTRLTVDARGFSQPFGPTGTLATRVIFSSDRPAEQGAVPFFLLHALGGGETLRAYSGQRWRDRALVHASVEYRVRLQELVEVAPFLDAGTVAPALARLDTRDPFLSAGLGLRLHWKKSVVGRLDWAWSSTGHRISVSTGPAF